MITLGGRVEGIILEGGGDPRGLKNSNRFISCIKDIEYILNLILEDIKIDNWPISKNNRCNRCTGNAISIGLNLLEILYPVNNTVKNTVNIKSKIILFIGGPTTIDAIKYYKILSDRALSIGTSIDMFCCSLDQVGFHEMQACVSRTGGHVVMCDSFSMHVFKDSLQRMLESSITGELKVFFNSKLSLLCSKNIKICGAIGNCVSTNKKGSQVSDTVIGNNGGTMEWALGDIDDRYTIAIYFEISDTRQRGNNHILLQFQTIYNSIYKKHIRIHTFALKYAYNIKDIYIGFDQEVAVVILCRIIIIKLLYNDIYNIIKYIDNILIKLTRLFSNYNKNDINTIILYQEYINFPQFIYHLRRSNLLQIFNTSPDETAFYRTVILSENTVNSLIIIQPALLEYSFESINITSSPPGGGTTTTSPPGDLSRRRGGGGGLKQYY
eukprot:GHVL01026248.1.p1 GENE.GHVL01026248.1~~GHVL01026248.1.p1  ORF type:complete len:439 (-),score=135.98 GHVL01026248.1:522-1838(-)